MEAGERLKEIRNRLGITTREVEEHSRRIAESEANDEFFISNSWLTQIENKENTPSIYKLLSLSVIYRTKFTDLLMLYGVDLEKIGKYQLSTLLEQTHLTDVSVYDGDRGVSFPVRFDPGFTLDRTGLLSRLVETWAEVPIGLIQHLNINRSLYGYVGLKDYSLYPILRPGSFVQIDDRQTKIQKPPWRTEFDRPIYFVELRDGYACSWCELHGKELFLVPHPLSGCSIRRFAYPNEVEIVGRITGVAMRIVNPEDVGPDEPLKQLRPS